MFLKNFMCVVLAVLCFGCAAETTQTVVENSVDHAYLADQEPEQSMPVGDARQQVQDGEQIALLGHIGGSKEPFVDGLAAFTIVDPKVDYCLPDEQCPTPWDYCCKQNEVKDNIATVKIVDENGATVARDAKGLLGVKELSLVVVQGTAQRDEQGNLTLLATKVFVKQ